MHLFQTSLLRLSTAILILTFIASCKKDEPNDEAAIDENPIGETGNLSTHSYLSGETMSTHFNGRVTDENNLALSDVQIYIGTQTTTTDTEGYWQLLDVIVDTERAYIKAEKEGYFHGSRVLTPMANNYNRGFIQLLSAQSSTTFAADLGAVLMHNSGSSVSFPANGYVDQNGNDYMGEVSVSMCYIDPSDDNLANQMPGNLTALESDNDFVALKSYGMIGVEMRSSAGDLLEFNAGSTAEIELAVPSAGIATAPASIPLWHFDEDDGVWIEEGSATLMGDKYLGEVSHFSFWNCDIPVDYIFLDGSVFSIDGNSPIQGLQILLISQGLGGGNAYSGADGAFGGIVPANTIFTMEVYSTCGELLGSQEIGPFDSDVTLPVIAIEEDEVAYITGTIVDCDGMASAGHISINTLNAFPEYQTVGVDGAFTITATCAPSDYSIQAYSISDLTASETVDFSTTPGQTIDIGALNLCENPLDEYITVTVEGIGTFNLTQEIQYYSVADSVPDNYNFISATSFIQDSNSDSEYFGITPFDMEDLSGFDSPILGATFIMYPADNSIETYYTSEGTTLEQSFEYTSYSDTPGDYITFEFSGSMESWTDGVANMNYSGSGRILRD